MDSWLLQNMIAKGMGVAARKLGRPFNVYRPDGAMQPLAPRNRAIKLFAVFQAEDGAPHAPDYGEALWQGIFDSVYTRVGDYLVGETETYFVAGQKPALPVQCVLTNRVVTVVRPAPAAQGGYSGFYATSGEPVIMEWPCSLLEAGGRGGGAGPNETRFGNWMILLPALPVPIEVADVVSDECGGTYVVSAAEQSTLGWRLLVRQIGA
jgi:hypothetical protein